MDFWIVLRYVSVAGALVALWLLASTAFRQWRSWNVKTRDHWITLVGWVFVCLYSMVESITRDIYDGTRWIVNALVITLTLRALTKKGAIKVETSQPWKGKNNESKAE